MKLQIFNFKENEVRTIPNNNEIHFVAKDICKCLDLENVSKALSSLDEDELTLLKVSSGGQMREMNVLNESGLYNLIFKSRKKEAKEFKRWVTSEVLPTLRKTGTFSLSNNEELKPNLNYTGGKVAHIFHNHQLNPTAFLNVKLINKLESMFGAKNTREFYSELVGIKIDETLAIITDTKNPTGLFVKDMIETNTDKFTKIDKLYVAYLLWLKKMDIKKTLTKMQFSRDFALVSGLKSFQKRVGKERPRVFQVEILN